MNNFIIYTLIVVGFSSVNCYTVRKIITSDKAPGSSRLSQAIQVGNTIYVSGNLGMNKDGEMENGIYLQTRLALENIGFILQEAGVSFHNVVKVTVLLSDISNYDAMNDVYDQFFLDKFPARAAYAVAHLPLDALVEIEVVAIAGEIIDI